MRYLTWRQFFDLREKLELTDEQLDEPALFTLQDGHGDQLAYPIGYWTESIHPSDGTSTLCLDGEDLEMLLPGEFERDEEEKQPSEEAGAEPWLQDEPEEDSRQFLRKLPLGGLRVGFSDMDEDFEEATKWLAQPNPHTPAAAPPQPGPAPLFTP